ncbi:MAG: ABC transporter permease [Bacilli bacterium]|nr:ABC transporter permease [Bacilli bacterium]
MEKQEKKRFKLPFHIVKRLDMPKKQYWIIKGIGFLVAFLLAGILCNILSPGSFGSFYQNMAYGVYNPRDPKEIFDFIETAGLLILVAFALAPAFKMKFWNIGAEGQISIACLVTAGITYFMADGKNDALVIFLCLFASILAGIIWAVIPAIFKAFFNTNETLFTLMMNYVATALISVCIALWITNGSQSFPFLNYGGLPKIFGIKYLFSIIIIVVVVALMIVYLKKTKHGYELSVVGASVNTARYVGINVKKVIIRTMVLSGALSGLVGFLLVAGHHHSLTATLADGRGFTGVLIAWLGQFQPGQMIMYGFLVAFFQRGSTKAASYAAISKTEFSAIVTGMFFLIVIATEFFVSYHFLIEEDSKLKVFVENVKTKYNNFMYGSNEVNVFRENIIKSKNYVKSNAIYMDQNDFNNYLDVLVIIKAPSDEEVNKDIINERKKEYALTKNESLKAQIKELELSLKWKKYINKKTVATKKSLVKIYKKEVARNGGSK